MAHDDVQGSSTSLSLYAKYVDAKIDGRTFGVTEFAISFVSITTKVKLELPAAPDD